MRHKLTLEGPAFRLRPVEREDAKAIVQLRNDETLGRFLHQGSATVEDQLRWQEAYENRPGDFYFVIETLETKMEGLVAIYNTDNLVGQAEWGRWILRHGSLAAVESALLVYRCAFNELNLNEVYCHTLSHNRRTVSFHDSCGITRKQRLAGRFIIKGQRQDAIEHRVDREAWPGIEEKLSQLSLLTARRVSNA